MTTSGNNELKTRGRPFSKGNPGRPRGARHKTTLAIEALFDGEGEEISRKAVELAKAGDMVAIKLVLDRIVPTRKGRPTPIDLPAIDTTQGLHAAVIKVIASVAGGELSAEEGAGVVALLDAARVSLQSLDLEARLHALEEHNAKL